METIDKASHSAHEAVDKIANATNQAAEAIGEKGTQLKNVEQQLMENCRGYVRDNPVTSLGIAIAGGFLLSRLLSCCPSDRK
ncbi:MAG: DUF883 domain-containing protein [Methylobacter sp.]|nr:DUF883 domain-containing protein [Methylobacter sp.]